MERGQPDENHAIQDFLRWERQARRRELFDTAITKEARFFIPHSELKSYLGSGRRLENLLDALFPGQDPIEQPSCRNIEQHYMLVFSILVVIGQGPFIKYFEQHASLQDQKLPFLERPAHFPFSTGSDIFDAFRQRQWEFCVPVFRYDMGSYFDRELVLPIIESEKIAMGGSSVIYKVRLMVEYDELEPPRDIHGKAVPENHTYIIKSYRTRNARHYYTAEKKAIMRLRNGASPPPNIVGYYGSFIQDDKYYALLEYMDSGTLEGFMKDVSPPRGLSDITKFWDSLFGLIRGLTLIHGLPTEDELDEQGAFLG